MRVGYSLNQSEIVAASELDYGDCARFQVTCPCCREAVFKKVRLAGDGTQVHFLSHYKADSADAKECELRVAAMSDAFLARWSNEGRQQTLARFMAVLRHHLVASQARMGLVPAGEMRGLAERLLNHPSLPPIVDRVAKMLGERCVGAAGLDRVRKFIEAMGDFRGRSEFWRRRQAAYVTDVLGHLLTGQAAGNLRFTITCAMVLADRHPKAFAVPLPRDAKEDIEGAKRVIAAIVAGRPGAVVDGLLDRHERSRRIMDEAHRKGHAQGAAAVTLGLGMRPEDEPSRTETMIRAPGLLAIKERHTAQSRAGLLAGGAMPAGTDRKAEAALHRMLLDGMEEQARGRQEEINRDLARISADIHRMEAARILAAPIVGLLAAVPFPDLAAPPGQPAAASVRA